MSATTALRPAVSTATRSEQRTEGLEPQPGRSRDGSKVRPGWTSGRGAGPLARPARRVDPPRLRSTRGLSARSCTAETAVGRQPSYAQSVVRLTDRGIAVILVTGVMIVWAAATVVGLTALRVTGDGAQPLPAPYAAQP